MPLAFRRPAARRLTLSAAACLLGAALPRPAAAQFDIVFPTCATGTLTHYLSQLGCTMGGAVFANFTGGFNFYLTPAVRTPDDVLVQPLALGNTVTFAFTIARPVTIVAYAPFPESQTTSVQLAIGFDVFGWPSRPGGSAYLPLLPLAIGNVLDADPGLMADVEGLLRTRDDGVLVAYSSLASVPSCLDRIPAITFIPCMADPRGIAFDFDGGHVDLSLDGHIRNFSQPAIGARASVTLGAIAVGFELPPLPSEPPATTVPEPGTWALLGTGLLGVWGATRRRRARPAA